MRCILYRPWGIERTSVSMVRGSSVFRLVRQDTIFPKEKSVIWLERMHVRFYKSCREMKIWLVIHPFSSYFVKLILGSTVHQLNAPHRWSFPWWILLLWKEQLAQGRQGMRTASFDWESCENAERSSVSNGSSAKIESKRLRKRDGKLADFLDSCRHWSIGFSRRNRFELLTPEFLVLTTFYTF